MTGRRRPTATSAFGVGRRESHDSSGFYARFQPPVVSDDETVVRSAVTGKIVAGDARRMDEVEDNSVALVVTSPPYFAGKEYEAALGEGHVPASYLDYLRMLGDVFAECVRTLEPGGRLAVNVANLGRKPYRSLAADVAGILQDQLGLLLRGEIVWVKARAAGGSCAWGSFQSPANPVLRDVTERVLVASKGRFARALSPARRRRLGLPAEATISRDEFMDATTDVWDLPTESAVRVGHPAPFPVELPQRLIELYTYEDDLVLDPFVGSGTTAVAAVRTGRRYVGYDTEPAYVELAERRVRQERDRVVADAGAPPAPEGARRAAEALLAESGFAGVGPGPRLAAGVQLAFSARDRRGGRWLFDLCGGHSLTSPGLRRSESLWRALGRASVVHALEPDAHLVLLTPAAPPPGSPGERAWRALVGGPLTDVVELGDPAGRARLAAHAAGRAPTR